MYSCNNDEPEIIAPLDISGKITFNSECKSFDGMIRNPNIPDSLSCIKFNFDEENNKLTLNHINSAFNCCPGTISCNVTTRNDTIIIKETEKESLCNCNCLYDLDIEINGVTTSQYFLKFEEPYIGNQGLLDFQIDLSKNITGEYCVKRTKYPWSLH